MADKIWSLTEGHSPLVAAAIHNGHDIREEILPLFALPGDQRLREEDPFTAGLTGIAGTRLIGLRSRFEVDLNRPREKAVYLEPEDAWGLHVWKLRPGQDVIRRSLAEYDDFYREAARLFTGLERQYKRFVVLDIHSYNHRREGPDQPAADPESNPEINIGTGTMDRGRWAPLVDRFIDDLRVYDFDGRHLDVRENIKFKGGYFPKWIHEHFSGSGCVISIEFKKFFMNEWTGEADPRWLDLFKDGLRSTVPGILEELGKMGDFA